MTPGAILERLRAEGITLRRDGPDLIVTPREALTDELRALILAHKAELLEAVEIEQAEPLGLHVGCYACDGCRNLAMASEYRGQGRRFFWFACSQGFPIMEAGYHGERVLLAPAECNRYDPAPRH